MWISGEFLAGGHVACVPAEEKAETHVNEAYEDGRVEDGLPHCGRAKDGATPEEEEQDLWGGFGEGVDYAV